MTNLEETALRDDREELRAKLQEWRDWAANLLEMYYDIDPIECAMIRLGGDVSGRTLLALNLGMGAGGKATAEREFRAILGMARSAAKIAEVALRRLRETAGDAVARRREPARSDAGDGADRPADVSEGGDPVRENDHPDGEPKL